jgi:uncharacterized protein (DUF1778 family)
VTSFIMRTVLPAAREVVDKAERIQLGERDTVRILHLLENPPPPTPALLAAASRERNGAAGLARGTDRAVP